MIPNTPIEVLQYSPIVLVVPPQVGTARSSSLRISPLVVLIFRWMGAKDAHAFKFIKEYVGLYPEATQIVVACPQTAMWLGENRRERALRIVPGLLRVYGVDHEDPKNSTPLLVHCFLNSGSLQLMSVARLMMAFPNKSSNSDVAALPAAALIFDSCPSSIDIAEGSKVFTVAIKSPWLRFLASYVIHAILVLISAWLSIVGENKAWSGLSKDYLDPTLLPVTVPRLYIYSKADEDVSCEAVEAMVNDEIKAGRVVRTEVYDNTPHVGHARADETRYWGAVKRIWEEGLKKY